MPKINLSPKEDDECKTFSAWLTLNKIKHTHIPNENSIKSWGYIMKMKAMGKFAGFPDYVCIVNKKLVFVEMKRSKGGTPVSPAQKSWISVLNECDNVQAYIAKGADEAIKIIERIKTIICKNKPQTLRVD